MGPVRVIPIADLAQHLDAGRELRVVASGNFATPTGLLAAVDAAQPRYRLFVLNAQHGIPDREGVTLETCFVGPGMRRSPRLHYVPSRLSLAPVLFREAMAPDVLLLHTSVPQGGTVSLGIEVNILPAALEAVRARGGLVIAQLNSEMPYTFGDAEIDCDLIDLAVEVDEPLPHAGASAPDDISAGIGQRVASLVPDGATLQTGIGAVPDAALYALHGHRRLRFWTEVFSDGVLALDRAGSLDADHPLSTSFLFGSAELYSWVDRNPRVILRRTEVINAPARIAENPAMISVNAALEVDLFDQANAMRINGRIYSGFGGQPDFVVGALHSRGGKALVAMRSWQPKADVSTIVPLVDEPATSLQHSAVVTEQGVAEIYGRSMTEQARNLIDRAAHPDIREELREEAAALGLA
jgi:acyl-CoA hydrolase